MRARCGTWQRESLFIGIPSPSLRPQARRTEPHLAPLLVCQRHAALLARAGNVIQVRVHGAVHRLLALSQLRQGHGPRVGHFHDGVFGHMGCRRFLLAHDLQRCFASGGLGHADGHLQLLLFVLLAQQGQAHVGVVLRRLPRRHQLFGGRILRLGLASEDRQHVLPRLPRLVLQPGNGV